MRFSAENRTARRTGAPRQAERFFTISNEMLCIAGFDGYFKRLNPAWEKILGFSEKELLSQPSLSFVHPDDREATLAEAGKLNAGADTISFQNRYLPKDGAYKWLSWKAATRENQQIIYAATHPFNRSAGGL